MVGQLLYSLMPYGFVFKHVYRVDVFAFYAAGFEYLHGTARKAAYGKARAAFHKQDDGVGFYECVNALLCFVHGVCVLWLTGCD